MHRRREYTCPYLHRSLGSGGGSCLFERVAIDKTLLLDSISCFNTKIFMLGPYASAILKFTVLFPTSYPAHPPIITFLSDIYHPLIVPPTSPPPPTASSTNSSPGRSQSQPSAAHYNYNQNVSNLPPGSFTLKHGFPNWYSASSPKTTSSPGSKKLPPNPPLTPLDPTTTSLSLPSVAQEKEKSILQVLYYLKSVFSSVSVLDDIPPHLAANLGAWRAWRSFREAGKVGGKEEGKKVWLDKVDACVAASKTDGVLYDGMGVGRGGGGLGNEEMVSLKIQVSCSISLTGFSPF